MNLLCYYIIYMFAIELREWKIIHYNLANINVLW